MSIEGKWNSPTYVSPPLNEALSHSNSKVVFDHAPPYSYPCLTQEDWIFSYMNFSFNIQYINQSLLMFHVLTEVFHSADIKIKWNLVKLLHIKPWQSMLVYLCFDFAHYFILMLFQWNQFCTLAWVEKRSWIGSIGKKNIFFSNFFKKTSTYVQPCY